MSSRVSRVSLAAKHGLIAGALGGLWVAFADYGATWLWLPGASDRGWLLLRVLASLVPLGAALGALLSLLAALATQFSTRFSAPRARRLWPLPFVVLSIAPLSVLAGKLCAGGMMARLAARWPIEPALIVLLPCALYALLWCSLRLVPRISTARRWPHMAALLLVASAGLAKLNQIFLPNLYEYLHASLALVVWGLAALGLGLVLFATERLPRLRRASEQRLLPTALALSLGAVACANAATLDRNLNVRVALFDPRSPSTRALWSSMDPLLRALEPPRKRRTSSSRGQLRANVAGLPMAEGAHVLLVTIDALRADHLGLYGYDRPVSPKLDAFAKGAAVFQRAYAQAPHSSYSLSSLHTSEYVHELVDVGRALPTDTLASALSAQGYHTAAFFTAGIFHTEGAKLSALRDSAFHFALYDHTNRESEQQTDRVLAEVDRIKQRGEPPTLLWVHYFDVHEPYQETTFGTGEMDRYDSEILHVDRELDRLIAGLEKRLSRPLVIAISADHGEEFREHGGVYHGSTLFDEQVRVPLLLRMPGLAAARVAAPVEVIDIAPTLLGAVGAPIPASMRGRDLRAVSLGKAEPKPVFSAVLTKRMALQWPYKLIADLRFDLYELYDLASDPQERINLASAQPARVTELRELVYGWLDAIDADPPDAQKPPTAEAAWQRALHLGRLGDRRAVAPTAALLLDRQAPVPLRVEAGQNLAKLADPSAVPALLTGLETEPPEVAAEAAIALGRMYDARARPALLRLVQVEDPHVRARAAVSLGRLRDRAAVPALIDALWVAPTQYEREEAVRWLGRLRDPAAVEPLLTLLPEFSLRYLLAVALGQIGDARAYDALSGMLEWESRTNIRDEVVRGLGLLGDARAIPLLLTVLEREPTLKNTGESLVRLGALDRGDLGGLDAAPKTPGLHGFARCVAGPPQHDWNYLERTHCTSERAEARLMLPPPRESVSSQAGASLVVRARRADGPEPVQCALRIANGPPLPLTLSGAFVDRRYDVSGAQLERAPLPVVIACEPATVRVTLDHVLLAPHGPTTASAASERPEAAHDAPVVR